MKYLMKVTLPVSVKDIQKIELMTGVEVDTNQFGTPSLQIRHAFTEIGLFTSLTPLVNFVL